MNNEAKNKLAIARRLLVKKQPYLSSAVYALAPVEVANLMETAGGGTAVTETMVLLYDPEVIVKWSDDDTTAALAHEVGHVMRDHIGRGQRMGLTSKEERWLHNIAGDRLINDDLLTAGFKLLPTDITSATLGMQPKTFPTVEETYFELKKRTPPNNHKRCCGSGAGNPLPNEGTLVPGSHPAHRTPAVTERVRREVAEEIRKHANGPGRGSIPGGWLAWADLQLQPVHIPWQQKLARRCRNSLATRMGDMDYVYSGMSHLQGGLGFGPGVPVLPCMRAYDVNVTLALDTSGSMGKHETELAISHAAAIIKASGANIQFLACDCAIHKSVVVRNINELMQSIHGGGGTSFVPVFEHLAKVKRKTNLLIFITDGGGDAPATPPPYDTIWLLVGQHRCTPMFHNGAQPWGEILNVD